MKKKKEIKKLNETIKRKNKEILSYNLKNAPFGRIPPMETYREK